MILNGQVLLKRLPTARGRLEADAPLADLTWFRTGGPAEVLFAPADEADLAEVLRGTPGDVPVIVIGVGSNLLVRDGGVPGLVVRLGRGFSDISLEAGEASMTHMTDGDLDAVRTTIPAARCLPLLEALARGTPAVVLLAYGGNNHVRVSVTPCQ